MIRAIVHFIDWPPHTTRLSAWVDHGILTQKGDMWVLHVDPSGRGGTRVFPLGGRDVEVYLPDQDQAVLIYRGHRCVHDRLGAPPAADIMRAARLAALAGDG